MLFKLNPATATVLIAGISGLSLATFSTPASAATLHNGWHYSIDSFNDSMAGYEVGGTPYEIYGTALQQTNDSIIFAINSNLGLDGKSSNYAVGNHTGWGDLLFNFSGNDLDTANANGDLFGIRFAENSKSGVSELGVYENVRATEIAWEGGNRLTDASLSGYINWITQHGGNPQAGDLSITDPYFNLNRHVPNSMVSGTKIGDIQFLSDINSLGLDFGHFGAIGTHTFAFQFDRTLLPDGDYVYTLAPECDNDIIAGTGTLEPRPVPEPSSALAVGLVTLAAGALKSRRRSNGNGSQMS